MKVITVYLFLLSLVFISSQDDIGLYCEAKAIEEPFDEYNGFAGDVTLAHHKVASCASLNPYSPQDNDGTPKFCCYVKLKYKLEGEKFTRKGCTVVDSDMDIDSYISVYESAFQNHLTDYYSLRGQEVELKDVDASIDCNSKFLKYSALLFLILLF